MQKVALWDDYPILMVTATFESTREENRLIYTGPSYAKKPLTLLSQKGIRKINSSLVVLLFFH